MILNGVLVKQGGDGDNFFKEVLIQESSDLIYSSNIFVKVGVRPPQQASSLLQWGGVFFYLTIMITTITQQIVPPLDPATGYSGQLFWPLGALVPNARFLSYKLLDKTLDLHRRSGILGVPFLDKVRTIVYNVCAGCEKRG